MMDRNDSLSRGPAVQLAAADVAGGANGIRSDGGAALARSIELGRST
jgi:hypothetical protein